LPPAIYFQDVFARASFLDNPTIYSFVIGAVSLYIILAIVMAYLDKQDNKRCGITIMADNIDPSNNNYLYEIVFYSGSRKDAQTDSKVKLNHKKLQKKNLLKCYLYFIIKGEFTPDRRLR
jgi:hypothetical protein